MKASASTEQAVQAMFDDFMAAYADRDMDRLLGGIVQDDSLVLFGTGADERRVGIDEFRFQAERDWSQMESLAFNINWQKVSESGDVAWIAAEGTGVGRAGGQDVEFPFRLTAVLEKHDGKWLMAQSHFSLPASGQEEGESSPV